MTFKKNKTIAIGVRLTTTEYKDMIKKAKKWSKERGVTMSYSAYVRSLIKGIK